MPNRPRDANLDPIPTALEEIDRDIDYWTGRLGEGQATSNHEYWVQTRLTKLNRARQRLLSKTAVSMNVDQPQAKPSVLVVISHSSGDALLASELTEFLRVGLALHPEQIRCSSVDGYRLPAGVNTEAQLREEVNSANVLIGLITPNSLSSPYVLFELGARWGAKLPMLPLLAGVKPDEMRGPLSSLNALSGSSEAQLHQLLSDISKLLNVPVQAPASYLRYLESVKQKADGVSAVSVAQLPAQESMVFEESVCWKRGNGGREGPYCPNCYEDKRKEIHLTPRATKGTFRCGVCRNTFATSEYDPRPISMRPHTRGGPWS